VFVADSQRAMLQANVESFRNLEENLTEMGLAVDTLPLVLQFNKRDLADICSVEEMNAALNRHNWPFFESSAVTGTGVFETLKGISRFTLMSLKKRLGRNEPAAAPARPAAAAQPAVSGAHPQAPPPQAARPAAPAAAAPRPMPAPAAAPAPPKAPPGTTNTGKARTVDVLGELEKLRREAAGAPVHTARPAAAPAPPPRPPAPAAAAAPAAAPAPAAGTNGRGELSRNIEMSLRRADFQRARRVLISFQVEDEQHQVMDAVRDLPVDIKDAAGLEKLLLRLNIALNAKE
jgi:hypothetical protein